MNSITYRGGSYIRDLTVIVKNTHLLDFSRKDPPYLDTYCWILTPPRKVMLNETNGITGVDHYTYTCSHPTPMQ